MAGFRGKPNRHIRLKGKVFQFKIGVPVDCRDHFNGKANYVETTGTGDIVKARERRNVIEKELTNRFRLIRAGLSITDAKVEAERFAAISREALLNEQDPDQRNLIVDIARDYSEALTPADQKTFDKLWSGQEDVDKHVDVWLAEAKLAPKTTQDYRGILNRLSGWCKSNSYTLSDITRKVAGTYVTEQLLKLNNKTAKKHLGAIVGYWEHLARRGHVDKETLGNPWTDQIAKERSKQGTKVETERPFTDNELTTVLYGSCGGVWEKQLQELALISVLSGIRLSEITGLTVEACAGSAFDLSKSKTQAGVRAIPRHSLLSSLIAKRTKDKQPTALLFNEFTEMPNAADTLSKAFTRRRVELKVDEKREGIRRSLVNFHSLRRTFITKARHAHIPETTIADVVGHDTGQKKSITFGVYTEGASLQQKKACVEAVKLP